MSKRIKEIVKRFWVPGSALFLTLFLCFGFVGLLHHTLQRGSGGWIVGGEVHYVNEYGKAYSWEPGYEKRVTGLKGYFPETECGALSLDIIEWKTRKPDESNKVVVSKKCDLQMSLSDFLYRYSFGVTAEELMIAHKTQSEAENVAAFNDLKERGVLDDVRYKQVIQFDWGNILHFITWVISLPALFAILFLFTLLGGWSLVGKLFRSPR
jgi:hypothetical protein